MGEEAGPFQVDSPERRMAQQVGVGVPALAGGSGRHGGCAPIGSAASLW